MESQLLQPQDIRKLTVFMLLLFFHCLSNHLLNTWDEYVQNAIILFRPVSADGVRKSVVFWRGREGGREGGRKGGMEGKRELEKEERDGGKEERRKE